MNTPDRIHRAVSADGTEIAARVHGRGPALGLLPAGPGDCETTWRYVLPFLRERFTCYLLNTRGRGLSADHPDHSPERIVEDIGAFVESIGEPVGLVEWGSFVGAAWSLAAAQNGEAVTAFATYDPLVFAVAGEEDAMRFDGILERVGELASEGRLLDAARSFVEAMAGYGYYTDEDMAFGATSDFWAASASNIPMFLKELQQAEDAEWSDPTEPTKLAGTEVPILVLHGARSHPLNMAFVRHVADHAMASQVRAIDGAGHYGPHTEPEAVADELTRFFGALAE